MRNYFDDKITYLMDFYKGVVEDNNDPEKLGRVRVRIIGVHDVDVPTEDLLWVEVMGSPTLGGTSGIGWSTVPVKGTYVWLFFEEGHFNHPVVFGTVIGQQTEANDVGFSIEEAGEYIEKRYGESSDINEIARGVITENTVIMKKNTTLDESDSYTEVAQLPSVYPHNNVLETHSGHMLELDDTNGAERVQLIDTHGNYSEMKLTEYIDKAVADKVNLIMGNLKEHIVKDVLRNIDGNVTEHIKGNQDLLNDGNIGSEVGGTLTEKVTGEVSQTYDAGHTIKVSADQTLDAGANQNLKAGAKIDANAPDIMITGSGSVVVSGGTIMLN